MRRPVLTRLAVGVGMLMVMILAPTACGGRGGSPQQEEEKANKVHRIPEDSQWCEGKPLPAGSYVTEEFKPAMSFRLGKGWIRGGTELRDPWDIRDIENDANWLGFLNAEEVYDPNRSGKLKIAPAPEDMAVWLQENPYLKTEKPRPTSVGGEKGVQFDAIIAGAPKVPARPDCPDLGLFHESAGAPWGVNKGEKLRFIVVQDVKGQTVTIVVETTPPRLRGVPTQGAEGSGQLEVGRLVGLLRVYLPKCLEDEFSEVRLSPEPIRPSARPTEIATPAPRTARQSTICLATSSRRAAR